MKNVIAVIIIFLLDFCVFAEEVIDKMDSINGWNTSLNNNAEAVLTTINGVDGKAIDIDYKLKAGSYVLIEKEFKTIDLSGGDLIKFQVKTSGNKNTLRLIVKDSTNKEYSYSWDSLSASSFQWLETDIIKDVPDQKIKFLKFEINSYASGDQRGSGSIYIGPIGLYQTTQTASTQIVDTFSDNNDGFNELLGGTAPNFIYTNGTGAQIRTNNQANDYLTLDYNYSSGTATEAFFVLRLTNTSGYLDISEKKYLKFQVWGSTGGEKIGIGLQDSAPNGSEVLLDDYLTGGITTVSQWVEIPLSDFTSPDLTIAKELKIIFTHPSLTLETNDITVYIDNLQFYTPSQIGELVKSIDTMDKPLGRSSPWIKAGSTFSAEENKKDSTINVNIVDTEIGKATKMYYDFNDGVWMGMERFFSLNLFAYDAFVFDFKGKDQNNDFEVKFTDDDGTVYKKKFYNFTDTKDKWKNIQILPGKDLVFESSGNNDSLKLTCIEKITFGVIKNAGGEGRVAIDDIKISDYSPKIDTKGKKIIRELKISPNPFSPDQDGFEDEINFVYTLKKEAQITVSLYDLKGNQIHKLESGTPVPADVEHKIQWTGRDYANKIAKNGIYFIKFFAKTMHGEEEDIKSIISVLK